MATVELKGKKCPFFDVHRVEVLRLSVGLGEKVGGDLLGEDGAQLGLDDGIRDGGVGLLLGGRPQVTRVMSLKVSHVEDEAAGVRGRGGRLQQLRGGEGQVWLEAAQTRRPNVDNKFLFLIHEKRRILH